MTQEITGKTKMSMLLAIIPILVLLSGVLVVPLSAYAENDHNEKDNDKSKSNDRKDKDDDKDKGKHSTCESEKYEKQCNDIAADKRDVAHDEAAIDRAQHDLDKDKTEHHGDVAKDQKALNKAKADLAKDTADLTADLASV